MGSVLGVFENHDTIIESLLKLLPENVFKGIHATRLQKMKDARVGFQPFQEFLQKIDEEYSVTEERKGNNGCIEWIVLRRKTGDEKTITYYCSTGGLLHFVYINLYTRKSSKDRIVKEAVQMFPGRQKNFSFETLEETREACSRIVARLLGSYPRNWLFAEMLKEFRDNQFNPEKMWKLLSLDLFKKDVQFLLEDCKEFMNTKIVIRVLWRYKEYNHGPNYELDFFSFMVYIRHYCEIYKEASLKDRDLMALNDWNADILVERFKKLEEVCEKFGKPRVRKDSEKRLTEGGVESVFADFYKSATLRSPSYAAAHLWKHGFVSNFYQWKDLDMSRADDYFGIPRKLVTELWERRREDIKNNNQKKRDYNYDFPLCSQNMTAYSCLERGYDSIQVRSLMKPDGTMFVKTIIKGPLLGYKAAPSSDL